MFFPKVELSNSRSEIKTPRQFDGEFCGLLLFLSEGVDEKFEISANGIKNGAGTAALLVFFHFGFGFGGSARGGDL